MRTVAHTQDDTAIFASDVVAILKKIYDEGGGRPAVLTLSGKLGSGKTFLTKCIAEQIGVRETVISPTFIIRRDYETTDSIFRTLIHIDAYRLNDSDTDTVGLSDIFRRQQTLIIVEWPDNIRSHIPFCTMAIFAHTEGSTHTFNSVYSSDGTADFLTEPTTL